VGALEPRKAPDVLRDAWQIARERGLAARLVVVGNGRVPLDGPGVEHRGHVTDLELSALYDGALALVMPSRLEGFGLPPLEAALRGTPSICSELPALRESLGEAGSEWVTPGDAGALAEALLRFASDGERRRRVAEAGRRAAEQRVDPLPAAERMRALLAEAAGG
jgi:glycosyltransferase involved in cell wall biosynthesis